MPNDRLAQVHTAEHILWKVLKGRYPEIQSVSLQLASDRSRADYRLDKDFSLKDLQELEKETNRLINQNLTVKLETVSRQEAEKQCDLSLVPPTIQQIRLVKIGDVSCEACIGKHVNNTSQIGKFTILDTKKVGKDTYRIYFTMMEKRTGGLTGLI